MKSGLFGFAILASLVFVAVIVPFYAPYDVVRNWSSYGPWQDNPRYAAPEWSEVFTGKHLPRTMIFENDTFRRAIVREYIPPPKGPLNITLINMTKTFYYDFDDFPSELSLAITAVFPAQSPAVQITLSRPDGQFVPLLTYSVRNEFRNRSQVITENVAYSEVMESKIRAWIARENNGVSPDKLTNATILPEVALFAKNDSAQLDGHQAHLLKGFYQLIVEYTGFTLVDDVGVRFIVEGTVYGLAGTDDHRRDLLTGLLWGAPIALAFGVAAGGVVVLIQTLLVALSVPAFIFVEASLSFLGLGDPVLPTWGAIIGEAYTQGALFYGWWWWIVFPSAGIIYTTIGFALLGYAFDKVLNPRLREE